MAATPSPAPVPGPPAQDKRLEEPFRKLPRKYWNRKGNVSMKKSIAALCTFVFLLLGSTVWAAQPYLVTGSIAPVYESPGKGKLAPQGGWESLEYDENILAVAVYGNRIPAAPAKGNGKWLELFGYDGTSLGFAEKKLFTPFPEYTPFEPRAFWVASEGLIPTLFPGERPLKEYGDFSLPLGVVLLAEGKVEKIGETWLLCRFESDLSGGDAGGTGSRYAWIPASKAIDLAGYIPYTTKVQEEWLPKALQGAERAGLLQKGFFIDPKPLIPEWLIQDDLVDLYSSQDWRTPRFIAADLPLHAFHLYFDRMLQKVESDALMTRTAQLLIEMNNAADDMGQVPAGEKAKAALALVEDYLSLAGHLLTNGREKVSGRAGEIAKDIESADIVRSPFTEQLQDYTLFTPRGHYTLSPVFEGYFRATYLLGTPFPLETDQGAAATLIFCKILEQPKVQQAYRSLVDPIGYLVGSSNVNSWDNLHEVAQQYDLSAIDDETTMKKLKADLDARAMASTIQKLEGKKFALLPRRVTFDAFIFDTLTTPRTGTLQKPRDLPDPADVMAVLGSRAAIEETKGYVEFEKYSENRESLAGQWPDYKKGPRGKNVYTTWLSLYGDYFGKTDSKQFFANTPEWEYKKLLTAEASMAELKHDTILYAEQSGAEMGGGMDWTTAAPYSLPVARGYVEPAPVLYRGLADCAMKVSDFLAPLFPDEQEHYRQTLGIFAEVMKQLADIAVRQGEDRLTVHDFAAISTFGLPSVLPEDIYEANGEEAQQMLKMALIADVATDPGANVLFTGIGTPRRMSVYVNDKSGGARVATGYVFSYYTFARSISEGRMNDDQWKKIVYDEGRQDELEQLRPQWYRKHLEP